MARHSRKRTLSRKEQKAKQKADLKAGEAELVEAAPVRRPAVSVALPETVTVRTLSDLSGRTPAEIVGALLTNGVVATVNDSVDRETVEIIADQLDLKVASETSAAPTEETSDVAGPTGQRPPVVVVLGHVDHGKTTLLDMIRQSQVAAGESGGITQHIGAYQVEVRADGGLQSRPSGPVPSKTKGTSRRTSSEKGIPRQARAIDSEDLVGELGRTAQARRGDGSAGGRTITFIDTPGHEAFSAMRAHGATITDIAVLVVAADDGVKPQTKEALSHIRAANLPVVVAITKIDKAGANVERVKGQLAELQLSPEDWGGKTPTVPLSSKTGEGIEDLLETIVLVADLAELQARLTGPAGGVVIESGKERGFGPVATVLVEEGTLAVGDSVVIGSVWGRLRTLRSDRGLDRPAAGPSTPVQISGLSGVPAFGSRLSVVPDERTARTRALADRPSLRQGLQHPQEATDEGDQPTPQLSIIVKADADGSVTAIRPALEGLVSEQGRVAVIGSGVGDITESDLNLALAADHPFIAAFRSGATPAARKLARQYGLEIQAFDIIYRLVEAAQAALGSLGREAATPRTVGHLEVLKVFRTQKSKQIIGGLVQDGYLARRLPLTIIRSGGVVGSGVIESLQVGKEAATRVSAGKECGLGVATTEPIAEGDSLEVSAA